MRVCRYIGSSLWRLVNVTDQCSVFMSQREEKGTEEAARFEAPGRCKTTSGELALCTPLRSTTRPIWPCETIVTKRSEMSAGLMECEHPFAMRGRFGVPSLRSICPLSRRLEEVYTIDVHLRRESRSRVHKVNVCLS